MSSDEKKQDSFESRTPLWHDSAFGGFSADDKKEDDDGNFAEISAITSMPPKAFKFICDSIAAAERDMAKRKRYMYCDPEVFEETPSTTTVHGSYRVVSTVDPFPVEIEYTGQICVVKGTLPKNYLPFDKRLCYIKMIYDHLFALIERQERRRREEEEAHARRAARAEQQRQQWPDDAPRLARQNAHINLNRGGSPNIESESDEDD